MCWAPDCKYYNKRETCETSTFLYSRRTLRNETDGKNLSGVMTNLDLVHFYACHFCDGIRENGPEIFLHNVTKKFSYTGPEKRKIREQKVVVQEHLEDLPAKRRYEGYFEPDVESPPSEMEMIVVDDPSSSAGTSVLSDLPEPSQPGTSVETQPLCSKDSAAVYPTSSVVVEADNCFLKKRIEDLEHELKNLKVRFSFNHIKDNDSLILLYTGLPNATIFLALYHLIEF